MLDIGFYLLHFRIQKTFAYFLEFIWGGVLTT